MMHDAAANRSVLGREGYTQDSMSTIWSKFRHILTRPIPARTLRRGLAWCGAVLLLLLVYGYCIEPCWLEVVRVEVTLARLPPAFEGFTIAQLSDLHYGAYTSRRQIARAVAAVNRAHPDLVVLTGDYILRRGEEYAPLAEVLAGLRAPSGVYAIMGNHDCPFDLPLREAFAPEHITLLLNAAVPLTRGPARCWLMGLDDLWFGIPSPRRALRRVPAEEAVIALMHEPDYAETLAHYPVDLQLSGHSHGGQVRLPFHGALIVPENSERHPAGLARVGRLQVYTNRGIGVLGFPFRFNCRPEVTLLTLHAGRNSTHR